MTEQMPEQVPAQTSPGRRRPGAGIATFGAAVGVVLLVVAVAVIANQGGRPSYDGDGGSGIRGARPGPSGDVTARATVLDDGTRGPQLCLGGVAESYPPQCGGPVVVGWDWSSVHGFDHASGVRWGEFVVTGTYDPAAGIFTLTRPAAPAADYAGDDLPQPSEQPVWNTPCPEPAGGWRVVDPALTSQASLDQTLQAAQARPDFGSAWVDQSINPAAGGGVTSSNEDALNDPAQLILNVAVTGDPKSVEVELRKTWGGPLCVSAVRHTEQELQEIQEELSGQSGLLSSSASNDRVEVAVIWDDGSLQRQLDQRYGPGTVVVTSALQPAGS